MEPYELPSDELRQLLRPLTAEQLRYFVARMRLASDAEAAREIGVTPDTVLNWKNKLQAEHGIDLDELRKAAAMEGVITAFEILRRAAPLAAQVFVDGLNSSNEWVKLQAAREVLDRSGVRAADVFQFEVSDKLAGILRRDLAPWTLEEEQQPASAAAAKTQASGPRLVDGRNGAAVVNE